MRNRRSLRLPGFDYRGCHRYFLTYGTFARTRHFLSADIVTLVSTQFLRAAAKQRFDILTYCFMPDHVHLLVEATDDGCDGKAFIKSSKQYSGYHFKAKTGRQLWQRDSFERVLRNTEGSLAVARYILANPVRAGLVQRPFDYPYSGSFVWDRDALLDVFIESRSGYEEFAI
jgi:putative transposase